MISPQLHPDSPGDRPPIPPVDPSNGKGETPGPLPELTDIVMNMTETTKTPPGGDVVAAGLWHCLLGSLAAGLAASTLLGVLVLALSQIG
jgi:hypothetical protein